MDLGQPIETWDTSCRVTKVVIGLTRKAAFSSQSQQNTVYPVICKEVVGSFAMSW